MARRSISRLWRAAGCFGAAAIASVALLAMALLAYIGNGNVPLTAPLYNYSAANAAGTGFAIVGEQPLRSGLLWAALDTDGRRNLQRVLKIGGQTLFGVATAAVMMLALSGRALRTLAALLRWRGRHHLV